MINYFELTKLKRFHDNSFLFSWSFSYLLIIWIFKCWAFRRKSIKLWSLWSHLLFINLFFITSDFALWGRNDFTSSILKEKLLQFSLFIWILSSIIKWNSWINLSKIFEFFLGLISPILSETSFNKGSNWIFWAHFECLLFLRRRYLKSLNIDNRIIYTLTIANIITYLVIFTQER